MIVNLIKQDIFSTNGKKLDNFHLVSEKWGVHVYSCTYENNPAIVKYFENEKDKREIKNYRILNEHNIPTIKVFAYGNSSIVMENISVSDNWRLGTEEDMQDTDIAESLSHWYFNFHEKGLTVPELSTLEHDFDKINEATLSMLCEKLPEASEIFNYILSRYEKLRELIAMPVFTLTYNDFYWSNLIVRKDKREALMFDYNMLGKGYRYSDFRNVCWSMSKEAGMIFVDRYNKLYTDKYGTNRIAGEVIEKQIDDVMDYLYGLIMDFERGKFPKWKDNGIMLENLKKLLQ